MVFLQQWLICIYKTTATICVKPAFGTHQKKKESVYRRWRCASYISTQRVTDTGLDHHDFLGYLRMHGNCMYLFAAPQRFFFKVSFWCGHRLKIRRFLSVCACEVWLLMAIAILHAIRILKCTANCRHRVRLPTRATIGYSGNNGIIRIYRLFRVTFYRFHNRFVYCPLTMSLRRSRRCHCRIMTIKPLLGVI